jgi:hypothetical protein
VNAILGKQEKAPKGSLEEAEQMIATIAGEIDELNHRPPSTDVAVERKRLEDLAIAERTKLAWQSVLDGLLKEQAAQKLADAERKSKDATAAAAYWSPEDVDALLKANEVIARRKALADEEYQATGMHSYLKSNGKFSVGQSPQQDILHKGHEVYMDLLEALGLARKVSPSRGVYSLERIVEKGK